MAGQTNQQQDTETRLKMFSSFPTHKSSYLVYSEYLQATVPGGFGPCAVGSNAEPKFDIKGMAFPSAPLLGSNTSTADVFTSQKLNFL